MKSCVFDPRLRPALMLAAVLALAACTDATAPAAETTTAAAALQAVPALPARNHGVVTTALSAGGYSYIEVDIDGARHWLATMASAVQPGMKIAWQQYAVMNDFSSKALGRDFDRILFVDRVFAHEAETAAAPRRGIVTESMTAAGYSFIRVDENGSSVWLAAPQTPVDAGQSIEWSGGSLMRNFTSRSLDRIFEEIIFVGAVVVS